MTFGKYAKTCAINLFIYIFKEIYRNIRHVAESGLNNIKIGVVPKVVQNIFDYLKNRRYHSTLKESLMTFDSYPRAFSYRVGETKYSVLLWYHL